MHRFIKAYPSLQQDTECSHYSYGGQIKQQANERNNNWSNFQLFTYFGGDDSVVCSNIVCKILLQWIWLSMQIQSDNKVTEKQFIGTRAGFSGKWV